MRKQYSDDEKAEALAVFDDRGIWAACEASGATHTSIYNWLAERESSDEKKEGREERAAALRGHLKQRLLQVGLAHADRSDAAKNGRDAQAYATAAAIMLDKFRLEMGEHTQATRTESSDVARSARDKVDELAERRSQKTA